jgi:hypothetical protein
VGYVMAIVRLMLLSLFSGIVESVPCCPGVNRNGERVAHRRLNNRPKGFVLCRMTVLETIFEPTGVANETMYRPSTVCIPIVNKVESDNTFEISLPASMASLHQNELDSGRLFVNISDFTLGDSVVAPRDWARYKVVHMPLEYNRRVQQASVGLKSFAVVRVSTTDATPQHSTSALRTALFGIGINVKTQLDKCSIGQLQLNPVDVYDIALNQSLVDLDHSQQRLVAAAQVHLTLVMKLKRVSRLNVIVYCLPPGTGSWVASSATLHGRIVLNSAWCLSLSVAMHTVGRVLGLPQRDWHSNQNPANTTKYTGDAIFQDSAWPQTCYHDVDNWRLGWYATRTLYVDPWRDGSQIVKVAALIDFELTSIDEPVLVSVAEEWILQYNRAKSFNLDTQQSPNMVTLSRVDKNAKNPFGSLNNTIGLSVGDSVEVTMTSHSESAGSQSRNVRITFCSRVDGMAPKSPDVAIVTVALGGYLTCGITIDSLTHPSLTPSSAAPEPPALTISSPPPSLMPTTVDEASPSPSNAPTPLEPLPLLWRCIKVAAVSGALSVALGGIVLCLTNCPFQPTW